METSDLIKIKIFLKYVSYFILGRKEKIYLGFIVDAEKMIHYNIYLLNGDIALIDGRIKTK